MEGGEGSSPKGGELEVRQKGVIVKYEGGGDTATQHARAVEAILHPPKPDSPPRFGIARITDAAALVVPEKANPFLTDASGFLKQFIREHDTPGRQWSSAGYFETAARVVTQHAIETGNNELAEALFPQFTPAERWLLYANAYDEARLSPGQLAKWRLALETNEETSAESNSAIVNSARLIAFTEIELHNYRSTSDTELQREYLQRAREHKKDFKDIIKPTYEGGSSDYDRSGVTMGGTEEYNNRLSLAFAKAGIWEEVEEIDRIYPWRDDSAKDINSQLMVKALAGKLSRIDLYRLGKRKAGLTGKVICWIDAKRKGKEIEKPNTSYMREHIQDQSLLQQLAPELVKELDLRTFGWLPNLELQLATGDFENADATYAAITEHRSRGSEEALRAALMMSKYTYGLEVASAAHDVYERYFSDEIEPIEQYIATIGEDNEVPHAEELQGWLHELYSKTYELKSPQRAILLEARLAHLFRRIIPDDEKGDYLMMHVHDKWTAFEQQEGMNGQLLTIGESLKATGLRFIKRWKHTESGGYIGYEPAYVTSGQHERNSSIKITDEGTFVPESKINYWEQAASELNAMLGEERYIVSRHEETKPPQRDAWPKEDERRITLHGAWTNYGHYYTEISDATRNLEYHEPLNSMPDVTARLDSIMVPLVGSEPEGQ